MPLHLSVIEHFVLLGLSALGVSRQLRCAVIIVLYSLPHIHSHCPLQTEYCFMINRWLDTFYSWEKQTIIFIVCVQVMHCGFLDSGCQTTFMFAWISTDVTLCLSACVCM